MIANLLANMLKKFVMMAHLIYFGTVTYKIFPHEYFPSIRSERGIKHFRKFFGMMHSAILFVNSVKRNLYCFGFRLKLDIAV